MRETYVCVGGMRNGKSYHRALEMAQTIMQEYPNQSVCVISLDDYKKALAEERERVLEVVMTRAKLNYCDSRCGVTNCRYKREDDVSYALNRCERDELESINEVIEQIRAEWKMKYKKGKRISALDELYRQDVIFFGDKPLNKGFFQNWQMRFAKVMIDRGLVFVAEKGEKDEV